MTIVYKLWNTSGLADSSVQQETLNLIQSGNHYFITRVMWMVSLTMMTYDYGLTIEDEIQFVWHGNRIALSRILFLANRYWPMANLIINNILLATVATSHTRFCRVWFNAVAYSAFPIHVSIGTIQILRLHAMYSRNRMLLFVMCTLLALDLGVGTVIIGIVAYNIRPVVLPPGFTGCVLSHIAPYAWVYWLPMLIMESLLFVLSVVKSLDSMQNNMKMPHIMSVLFRDSVFYFAGVLGSIVLNFVVWNVARTTLFSAFLPTAFAMHSIIGCRMLLNIQKAVRSYSVSSAERPVASGSRAATSLGPESTQWDYYLQPIQPRVTFPPDMKDPRTSADVV